eukprot:15456184-Alexandrium_andersonii.AAC.1
MVPPEVAWLWLRVGVEFHEMGDGRRLQQVFCRAWQEIEPPISQITDLCVRPPSLAVKAVPRIIDRARHSEKQNAKPKQLWRRVPTCEFSESTW